MPQSWDRDPDAILTYQINWATWLGTDTISTVTWVLSTGLTEVSKSNTTTTATIKFSGGVAGSSYTAACKITTVGGLTDKRTLTFNVKQR